MADSAGSRRRGPSGEEMSLPTRRQREPARVASGFFQRRDVLGRATSAEESVATRRVRWFPASSMLRMPLPAGETSAWRMSASRMT